MTGRAIYLQDSLAKHLWQAGWAGFISLLAMFSFNAVDTYFISKLGTSQLTAFSFCFPIWEVVMGLAIGVGITTITNVASRLGAGKPVEAQQFIGWSIVLAIALGVVVGGGGLLGNDWFLLALGAQPKLLAIANEFMTVWYLSLPLILCWIHGIFAFRAYGRPKTGSNAILITAGLNLALDPPLIFGVPHWGFLGLGVVGAAWAGVIARVLTVAWMYWQMYQSGYFPERLTQCVQSMQRLMLTLLPAALTNMLPALSVIVTTWLLAKQTASVVAGYGIAMRVQMMVMTPMFALSGGVAPIIAQNCGAKQFERAWDTFLLACRFCLVIGLVCAACLWWGRYPIIHLFSHDEQVVYCAEMYFRYVPISYFAWGLIMFSCANYNATGKARLATFLSFVRIVVLFLPLAYWFELQLGYRGVFVASSVTNFLTGLLGFWMVRLFYRKKRLLTLADSA